MYVLMYYNRAGSISSDTNADTLQAKISIKKDLLKYLLHDLSNHSYNQF